VRETETIQRARHEVEVCNACRYCEGFCAVFPALELRREFSAGDLSYLANLCHGCRGCYYACQYAPPHEWGINIPRIMADVRQQSYAEYAWPKGMGGLFERNGTVVALLTAGAIAAVLILSMLLVSPDAFWKARPAEAGSFYAVIPLAVMQVVGIATFGFALVAMAMGARNFWRDAGPTERLDAKGWGLAIRDVLTLRHLGGGGGVDGCNDNSEAFSMRRRHLHHAMFYGFGLCFASTTVGFFYHALFGWHAPYAFFSVPVLLGTAGGILLTIGSVGLLALKLVDDPGPALRAALGGDVAMLLLLALAAVTGLVLLAVRSTGAMGLALAIHLGFILALFLALPYSKMVHGVYRTAALLRRAAERDMKPLGGE
jgi:citrate/tricarballylate utilization protein